MNIAYVCGTVSYVSENGEVSLIDFGDGMIPIDTKLEEGDVVSMICEVQPDGYLFPIGNREPGSHTCLMLVEADISKENNRLIIEMELGCIDPDAIASKAPRKLRDKKSVALAMTANESAKLVLLGAVNAI